VLGNRALREILGPKRTEDRCKLHNDEPYYLYFSSNIIKVIKSRGKDGRRMGHVREEKTCIQSFDGEL